MRALPFRFREPLSIAAQYITEFDSINGGMKKMNRMIPALVLAFLLLFSTDTVAQGLPSAKLVASDSARDALFGNSVAISGDTAVVGSWAHRIGGKPAQGAIYVFVRKGDVWLEQAKLAAADGTMKDYFGQRVAIDGDTIVVGVPQADIGKDKDQGAVYVFTRKDGHWAEQVKLQAAGGASVDSFGQSVGISGDTILVGAPGTDNDLTNNARQAHGAAYIFTRTNNIWSQTQKLTGDHQASVYFGSNTAIDNKTVVVSNAGDAGTSAAIYVFGYDGLTWKQEAKIFSPWNADEKVANNSITENLAISGNTFVVGGTHKDGKSDGAVYVYVRDKSKWTREAKLTPSDGVKADNFGWTVDIDRNTVIVGAWGMANGMRGAAYVFERKNALSGAGWVEQNRLAMKEGSIGDRFGCAVGITNDTIIIGADNVDLKTRNWNEGAAYIFNYVPSKPN